MSRILDEKYRYSLKAENECLEKINRSLSEAVEMKNQGRIAESEKVIAEMKELLECIINEESSAFKMTTEKAEAMMRFDKSVFPSGGEILTIGEKVYLRVIKADEKEDYLAVSYEYSFAKKMYEEDKFRESVWEEFISETSFVCSICKNDSGEFLGYCSIKNLAKKEWELAIELKKDECHKGYGYESLSLFTKAVSKRTGVSTFRIRVEVDNHASQGLMRKLGATPNGVSEFLLYGNELKRFQRENKDLITDEIRNVAKEFGMAAEEIPGYVLEYRLDMP